MPPQRRNLKIKWPQKRLSQLEPGRAGTLMFMLQHLNEYTHKNWRKNSGYVTGGVTGDALRLDRLPQLRL